MFLFIVISIILLILAAFVALTIGIFGAGAIIIFGDIIVCISIIAWIIKKLFFNKK